VEAVLNSFFEVIKGVGLNKNYRLSYRPYGTFEMKTRINPRKREEEIRYIHFRVGSRLKEKEIKR
jgi:nucleoid DNA-binding protein